MRGLDKLGGGWINLSVGTKDFFCSGAVTAFLVGARLNKSEGPFRVNLE